ncbi:protein POOR HOMOLOGOUS SYNAPSIS 1-like isoform X3 [Lolium perenne]|uniref:protein POOR HOMOLOGOUS SYNAPSIS 1-like isoform X3 n=1 Tax=Lolium perenne TaxID=4522 RepID=UPI0021F685DB|nr:protein POOR HOMOLOGOUS SYNAPSIS 1-like isoform X3 [Lolium perenne]
MAGSGGRSRDLPTSRADAAGGKRRSQRWEVEFARYFATPRRSPSTAPPPGLRFVSRGRNRLHGTWLPAASTAALCISRPSHSFAAHVLTVSIGDVVYEEHCVSILNFSWPQVACVTECPVRGSRVVFVSFCDRSKQIQKFAVRFPHLGDAESFLNSVKELSSNTMDVIPSGSDCVYEDSSSSEHIASDGPQYRPDQVASFEEPTSDHRTDASSLGYPEDLGQSVLPSPLATNIDSSYSSYLHSYSEMPTGYSIKNEKDINVPCPATATGHAPEKACTLDTCHDAAAAVADTELIADKGKVAAKEIDDILAGIKTYGGGDSFNGMNCYAVCGNSCCCAARGRWSVGRQPGDHQAQASNYQHCHGRKCLLLGCPNCMHVVFPVGTFKRGEAPGCTGDFLGSLSSEAECSCVRLCKRVSVIHPCGAAPAGLPSEIVSACRISPPASRTRRVLASPIRPCFLLRAGELSDDSQSPVKRRAFDHSEY